MNAVDEEEAWRLDVVRLSAQHHALRPKTGQLIEQVKRLLAETYLLLQNSPRDLNDDFADLDNEYLDECGNEWSGEIMEGNFSWQGAHETARDALKAAAGQLRAFDTALHSLVGFVGKVSDPTKEWKVVDSPVFVVPRRRPRRKTESGAGLSFSRNALVHHRVLPSSLGGCSLDFKWLDVYREPDPEPWLRPLGAAMFPPFRLDFEHVTEDGDFLVIGNLPTPSTAIIDQQIESSSLDRCFALVWPEVSLPPARQRYVVERLGERGGDLDGDAYDIDMLVLGSWHESGEKGHENVARIVDGYGEDVTTHVKVRPYRATRVRHGEDASVDHKAQRTKAAWQPRREAIVNGEKLTIIVTQDLIVAVLICRDLCDRSATTPFRMLDVDLILVPSFGNTATIESHAARAEELHLMFGTQTFVSQHPQDARKLPVGGHGWALAPEKRHGKTSSAVVQTAPYASYPQLPPLTTKTMAE